MSFKLDLKNFNKKTTRITEQVFRGTVIGLFNKVVLRTPVKTGRLKKSWRPTINSPSKSSKKASPDAIVTTVSKAKLGDSVYLVNNLPYAQKIEGGSSKQAPVGMVKVTVAEYQKIINEIINKEKGGL
tara:strand:- start:577 stop:960 length:384 start_codon:yes stop_codon:yes gene_type:complete